MSNDWTPELAKQWDATWSEPHMQEGLRHLLKLQRKTTIPVEAGFDLHALASAAHHRSLGQQDVTDWIENLRKIPGEKKPLPEPWSAEALGLKKSQTE